MRARNTICFYLCLCVLLSLSLSLSPLFDIKGTVWLCLRNISQTIFKAGFNSLVVFYNKCFQNDSGKYSFNTISLIDKLEGEYSFNTISLRLSDLIDTYSFVP